MRVALTGASGYTGGRLLEALRARGDEVAVLVRPQSVSEPDAVRWPRGWWRESSATRRRPPGSSRARTPSSTWRRSTARPGHPDSYYREVNVVGTERLLEAAARTGVRRFVHTSTVGVHGHVERPPADESAPFAPGDIYQATKAEAERLALDFHRRRGVPVTVVRPGRHLRAGRDALPASSSGPSPGAATRSSGPGARSTTPSSSTTSWTGFLLALDRPEAVGESFLVCGPSYVSQTDLAALVAKHTGGRVLPFRIPARPIQWAGDLVEAICVPLGLEPPLHRRRVDFWTKSRAFTIEKARRLLGYAPKVDLDEGIARTAAWYREAGWL